MSNNNFLHCFITLLLIPFLLNAQYSRSDWVERDGWMNVPLIFKMAGLQAGDDVADIGCHEGYLTFRLSGAVGNLGTVYAVDVRGDRLKTLQDHLKEEEIYNVDAILGFHDNPRLPAGVVDIAFVLDTYHEIGDYFAVLEHIKKSLTRHGRIVLIEKIKNEHRNKPREEQALRHTLSMEYVKDELEAMGFRIIKENEDIGRWENDEDKTIWILVAEKK